MKWPLIHLLLNLLTLRTKLRAVREHWRAQRRWARGGAAADFHFTPGQDAGSGAGGDAGHF
ncbi:hypothetical protein K7W42_13670 [Deinococcus sp. HMF7604]|uniref:hypothetical protein n=1 Tax=Deinococcus betulae TaxID=2873312 RepID=UPI001CCFF86A|nr:hypothetical protein [Deinococcus betulae]MBZ9751904.1 hypothetical protein [Deinococcus betulae]